MKSNKISKAKKIFTVIALGIIVIVLTVFSTKTISNNKSLAKVIEQTKEMSLESTTKSVADTTKSVNNTTTKTETRPDGTIVTTETITETITDGSITTTEITKNELSGKISYEIVYVDSTGKKQTASITTDQLLEYVDSSFGSSSSSLTDTITEDITDEVKEQLTHLMDEQVGKLSQDATESVITEFLIDFIDDKLDEFVSDTVSDILSGNLSGNFTDDLINNLTDTVTNISLDSLESMFKDMSKDIVGNIVADMTSDIISTVLPDSISDVVLNVVSNNFEDISIDSIKNTVTGIALGTIENAVTGVVRDVLPDAIEGPVIDISKDILSDIINQRPIDIDLDLGDIGNIKLFTYTGLAGEKQTVTLSGSQIQAYIDAALGNSGTSIEDLLKGDVTNLITGQLTTFLKAQIANLAPGATASEITDLLTNFVDNNLDEFINDVVSGILSDDFSDNIGEDLINGIKDALTNISVDELGDMFKDMSTDLVQSIVKDLASDVLSSVLPDSITNAVVDIVANNFENISIDLIKDTVTDMALGTIQDIVTGVAKDILPDAIEDEVIDIAGQLIDNVINKNPLEFEIDIWGNDITIDLDSILEGDFDVNLDLQIKRNEDGTFEIEILKDSSKNYNHTDSFNPLGFEIKDYTTANDGDSGMAKSTATKIFYCSEHGAKFEKLAGTLTKEEALKYGHYYPLMGLLGMIHQGDSSRSYTVGGPPPLSLPFPSHIRNWQEKNGERTYPFLSCTGQHYDLVDKNGSQYHPDLAYIITYPTFGEWDDKKQNAVWCTDYGKQKGKSTDISQAGKDLYEEALKYEEFHDKMEEAKEEGQEELSVKPEDKTEINDVRIYVDYDAQELTIGPYSIDYICGVYDEVTVGGISDMYFIGLNSENEVVKEKIEIDKYIYNNQEYDLEFFEPKTSDKSYVDYSKQVYPKGVSAGEKEFYLKIDDPNEDGITSEKDRVSKLVLHIDFQWMTSGATIDELVGYVYEVAWLAIPKVVNSTPIPETSLYLHNGYNKEYSYLKGIEVQDHFHVLKMERQLYATSLEITTDVPTDTPPEDTPPHKGIDITMKLGGNVWEEILSGKETLADGLNTTEGDINLKNIKVSLYDEDGNLVEQSIDENLESNSEESIYHKINPTYTDEDGNYLFLGLDPLKKYYVVFEYNGQRYLPTDYNMSVGEYNTEHWEATSKATEADSSGGVEGVEIGRDEYDERFQEISAYPNNYPSSNSLGVGSENAAYSQLDLMGYTLTENGTYAKTNTQWVDGYEYDENGLETDEWSEGEVSKKVREFIESNERFPSDDEMKSIYSSIGGGNDGMKIAQFIEDSNIQAYTTPQGGGDPDLYPVYDQFVINESEEDRKEEDARAVNYDTQSISIAGTTFNPIYPGQLYINLGLWRRQEFDAALRKDIYKAALKINDKTVIYTYEKRADEEMGANSADGNDNDTYWDINVRMSDYEAYYNTGYNRELYETDYSYDSAQLEHPGTDLEIYVTYKITVRNQSMSIMSQIKEVVDYYDEDYTFKPNLSWVTYMSLGSLNVGINKDEYYEMMDQEQEVIDAESTSATQFITNGKDAKVTEGSSRYGDEKNLGSGYKNLYIKGLENKTLTTGESAYIYLTFEVNKENNRIILDDESSPKENIAEINGFVTYYADGTELPNGITKNSGDIAGLLDRDSNPGNLEAKDIQGTKYEKNFEDDTDRAPSIRVSIDEEAIRRANGTVWEDERTENSGDAVIGDGIRQDDEIGISGVTVQLVEKCVDGSEYIWQETTTDSSGHYEFAEYIPGDYVIRFYYGDTEATVVPSDGQRTSYNGQDFKSTTYQDGIDQNGQTDIDGRYQGYINTATQNVSGTYNPNLGEPTEDTYGYDIYKADSDSTNYSDAKDIWTVSNRDGINIIGPVSSAREVAGRDRVIAYSQENVTNHIAEVLASPYSGDSSLYGELMDNTYMTAETGVIVVEFEYDRQQSEGSKEEENNASNSSKDYVNPENRYNSNYTLNNIDLGLTERPKSQLEIDKSVSNVKVTLANNSILFDINEAANNALWQDHKEYSVDEEMKDGMYEEYYGRDNRDRYSFRDEIANIVEDTDRGLIQLTMDEELMHGATIQVTYTIKITNVGETDYVDGENKNFYYKGDTSGAHISKTTTEQVVDYVQNNLQFEANNSTNSGDGWSVISGSDLLAGDLVNARLSASLPEFNTIIQTESFGSTDLEPGDEVSKTLILSQLITPENTEDDLQYTNMAEIVKTSNENGRRMAYSVVGNQDPLLDNPSEIDASMAERIIILTPFGENNFFYMIAGIVAVMLVVGIVLIKVFVLKKRD